MKRQIPATDSIEQLAAFWQRHDLTDYDDDLEEVNAQVFRRNSEAVRVSLSPAERKALRRAAAAAGVEEATLVQQWVREKLPQP